MKDLNTKEINTNVIFLDIDGVLVTAKTLSERSGRNAVADIDCVIQLNRITEATEAKLVLSSSWRFSGLEEMRLILKHWGVKAELIDMTPDHTKKEGSLYIAEPRELEIQAWLAENAVRNFIIIDDIDNMGILNSSLVKTEYETGITQDRANYAINILTA